MTDTNQNLVQVARLSDLQEKQQLTVHANGHTLALFLHDGQAYAVDNRCPHMGFPLDRGTVRDGILTCYWHYARFDLCTGGTFDQFADDVRSFPVQVRDGEIWVDVSPRADAHEHQRMRLKIGLERNISLVIAKAVLTLIEEDPVEPFSAGLDFGVLYRSEGWGQGLTMHVCMMNLLPYLGAEDRPRALVHGLSAVASDSAGHPPRFRVPPLPGEEQDISTLKRWFRQFIEVRDMEGAERCIVSAIRGGADSKKMADMLFAAVTDHRYVDVGHPADFTNKAFEALDISGWERAEAVLTSLVRSYATARRMEESNAWRYPLDLVEILDTAFVQLPTLVEQSDGQRNADEAWSGRDALVELLLASDPQATVDAMLDALRNGCSPTTLAQTVAYAAALRIARFHISNEFGDWDTALHTFTFANAIHQGLRRAESAELLRGVFDAAMSIYLDRFLNIPATRIPEPNGVEESPDALVATFPVLLDRQQQVNSSARQVVDYLAAGGSEEDLLAMLGKLLLREDRNFHTIQMIEAAIRQHSLMEGDPDAQRNVLVAAIRYLAAHSPTVRSQGQTYQIASRLHRGEELFEG